MAVQNDNLTTQANAEGGNSSDLMAVNLVAVLITAILLGGALSVLTLAAGFGEDEGPIWITFVSVFAIIVQLTGAMICVWHNHTPIGQATMRKVMGLVSWIMTGVSLFFLFIVLLAIPVALSSLD